MGLPALVISLNPRLCSRLCPAVEKWFWGPLLPSLTPEGSSFFAELSCGRHNSTSFGRKGIFLKLAIPILSMFAITCHYQLD